MPTESSRSGHSGSTGIVRLLPRLRSATAVAATALLLGACSVGAGPASGTDSRLTVVTTVSPLTSLASQVGGNHAQVVGIVPEGQNSHTFEPSPQVAAVLSKADLIFVNGLQLEDPTVRLAKANSSAPIVELGTLALPPSEYLYDFSFPRSGGKPNPHLWTDPILGLRYAAEIRDSLAKLDPANQADYAANYTKVAQAANGLDAAIRADAATVPGGVKLLTYHDAYAYVAQRYGWEIIGAIQPRSFADPTAAEVAHLIDQVRAEHVEAIFGSEVFPSSVLATIGNATGVKYVDTLRDDDLPGLPKQPGHSWQTLLRNDYLTMIEGLGGQAPKLQALAATETSSDTAEYPQ
jgi:ABC-type Zn uptake system ZnuABC Zn-binding protein ZnuA